VLLGLGDGVLAEVEDAGGEDGVGVALDGAVDEVVERADAAAGDDGHVRRVDDLLREREVEAVPRAVAVHAREQDLARAQLLGLGGPADRVEARRLAPAVGEDLVGVPGGRSRVDGDDDALGAELLGDLADQLRALDGGGVDAHLVRAGPEQGARVVDAADAAADRERDEHLLGGAAGDVDDRVACVGRCRDVEEDDLVGALLVVAGRELDRVAGVDQVDEVHALHDAPGVHVQTRDDTDAPHGWGGYRAPRLVLPAAAHPFR
jgi:hypothetical protein